MIKTGIRTTFLITTLVCLFFQAGTELSHATLFATNPTKYQSIGTGNKKGNNQYASGTVTNIHCLLDANYNHDINLRGPGKIEEEMDSRDDGTGNLIPAGFNIFFSKNWLTRHRSTPGRISGMGYISKPNPFRKRHKQFWSGIKASNGFGLYAGGGVTSSGDKTYSRAWDFTPRGNNGLSHHFSLRDEQSTEVPEPTAIFLFGTGIASLIGSGFLKKNRIRKKQ